MSLHRYLIRGLVVLLVLAILTAAVVFSILLVKRISSGPPNPGKPSITVSDFVKIVQDEGFKNIELVVYYVSPWESRLMPTSVESLIRGYAYKLTVSSGCLEMHRSAFMQLSDIELSYTEHPDAIDALTHFSFQTKAGKLLFSVTKLSNVRTILVNGKVVYETQIINDIIVPLLPDSLATIFFSY